MNYKKVLLLCALCISVCGMSVSASESETAESETVSSETSFPLTIEHAFGETIIESKPDRIAAVGWENQDTPLALGVAPVGVSTANYGLVTENNLHPWTDEAFKELGVDSPVVFDDVDGLDFEAISDTNPDVILASYSGLTQEDYDTLTQIAPVIPYKEAAWQTTWREQTIENAEGMGMKPTLRGYEYLTQAAALVWRDESRMYAVGEKLYKPIAEHGRTTGATVERLIRHAVESTMDSVGAQRVYDFFGNTIDPMRGKPTNAQMIGMLAQRMNITAGETE